MFIYGNDEVYIINRYDSDEQYRLVQKFVIDFINSNGSDGLDLEYLHETKLDDITFIYEFMDLDVVIT